MSKDRVNPPTARSWREIPQPLKPRAMSRGGRWRLIASVSRATFAVGFVGGLVWGGWRVLGALHENSKTIPAAVRAVPVKRPELKTDMGGVLDRDPQWLERTLALPRNVSLMELDLVKLRERLLADGQVMTASLTRRFPDRLEVQVTERTPIARVMAELAGERHQLLVARDGVIYEGAGYDPVLIGSLPWLDGIALVRRAGVYQPIPGIEAVNELFATARLEAEHLFRTWHIVSLARLISDREIEVRTPVPQAMTIVFGANGDYLRQLARLDYMWDKLAATPMVQARIDLSLGSQVPVTIEEPPRVDARGRPVTNPPAAQTFSALAPSQPKIKREF